MLIFRSYIKLPGAKGIPTQILCCSFRSQSPVGLTPINTGIGIIAKHNMWFCQIGNQQKYIGFYDLNTPNPRDLASKIHMERTWHILNDEGNTVCFSFTFAFYYWNNCSIFGNHQSWRQNLLQGAARTAWDAPFLARMAPVSVDIQWGHESHPTTYPFWGDEARNPHSNFASYFGSKKRLPRLALTRTQYIVIYFLTVVAIGTQYQWSINIVVMPSNQSMFPPKTWSLHESISRLVTPKQLILVTCILCVLSP